MDEYGISPFTMLRILGPLLVIGPILLWFLVMGPFVLYLVARWRAHREPVVDPQLGLKTALNYFGLIGFQIGLFAVMMIVWMVVTKEGSGDRGSMARVAFALLIPALIVFGVHVALLKRTNQSEATGVTRLFQGYNLLVTGLIGVTALFMVFQAVFMKGSSGELGRIAAAMLVVYGSAWVVCGLQFARITLDGPSAPMPPRDLGMSSSVGPQMSSSTTGGQLPSLGGGSFPPIDPK